MTDQPASTCDSSARASPEFATQASTTPRQLAAGAPATRFEEAYALGNGRLGALVYGDASQERIELNEDSLWSRRAAPPPDPTLAERMTQMRDALLEGRVGNGEALAEQVVAAAPPMATYQPLGTLEIRGPEVPEGARYERRLDPATGVVHVSCNDDDGGIERTVLVSHRHQVVLVRERRHGWAIGPVIVSLSTPHTSSTAPIDGGLVLEGSVVPSDGADVPPEGAGAAPGGADHRDLHPRFAVALVARTGTRAGGDDAGGGGDGDGDAGRSDDAGGGGGPVGGGAVGSGAGHGGVRFDEGVFVVVGDPHELELRLAATTDVRSHDLVGDVVSTLGTSPETAQVMADHETDERPLRSQVQLRIGADDDGLADRVMQQFEVARHLLVSSSRTPSLPANSQGVWNRDLQPLWDSAYTVNINLQMAHWAAGPLDLDASVEPLLTWLEQAVAPGTDAARSIYGCRGWTLHHMSDLHGYAQPRRGKWSVWPMAAAWLSSQLWDHGRFSGDADVARRTQVLLAGAVRFIVDLLAEVPEGQPGAGHLVPVPSHSPENAYLLDGEERHLGYGATMDNQICRQVLADHLEAADRLGSIDPPLDRTVAASVDRLAPTVVSRRTGGIQEWIDDVEEADPAHRHVSHLWGLFPADQIDPAATPELAAAAAVTLERRAAARRSIDEGDEFRAILESAAWAHIWLACHWARLGDGDRALDDLRICLERFTCPNGFNISHHVPQVGDAQAFPVAVLELLVQSHRGEVRLLPARPSTWTSGEVRGVRVRGGHRIDLAWEHGRLSSAELSVGHEGTVRLCTGTTVELVLASGEVVVTDGINAVELALGPGARVGVRPR